MIHRQIDNSERTHRLTRGMLGDVAWLNYHHLLHFWTVAGEGNIAQASKQLLLAQPTSTGEMPPFLSKRVRIISHEPRPTRSGRAARYRAVRRRSLRTRAMQFDEGKAPRARGRAAAESAKPRHEWRRDQNEIRRPSWIWRALVTVDRISPSEVKGCSSSRWPANAVRLGVPRLVRSKASRPRTGPDMSGYCFCRRSRKICVMTVWRGTPSTGLRAS